LNPYPGLRPFRASESAFFCGREVLDIRLTTRVHISPLTVLFARSGVGKSSFLTCRFMPQAMDSSALSYINEWGAGAPEDAIEQSLASLAANESAKYQEKPLLILDQFEDVFKLDCNRLRIWECLADSLNVSPRAHVLITMREEWLGAWGEASDYVPGGFEAMIRLAPLSKAELLRAVERPASVEGTIRVDRDVANRILMDLKKPNAFGLGMEYVEPGLLQLVCQRLWDVSVDRRLPTVSLDTYNSLGGADQIIRDYVWHELRYAGNEDAYFSSLDRVLWVGLTRHLSVVQGVKAIVSPTALATKMQMADFGIAGPAALDYELTRKQRRYLDVVPEKRTIPPRALVDWITRVLRTGVLVGFVKQQQGVSTSERLYELSHDALSPLLQEFTVEFEQWIRARWKRTFYTLVAIVSLVPAFIVSVTMFGLSATLRYSLFVVVVIALYLGLVWIMGRLLSMWFEALAFPVLRLMCKGDPIRVKKVTTIT
jgi:Novel STAND NTPase 1